MKAKRKDPRTYYTGLSKWLREAYSCSQCLTLFFARIYGPHVLGTSPFGTEFLVIIYLLPHTEILKGCALQCRLVKEQFTSLAEDEPKLSLVQSLDRAQWHACPSSNREPEMHSADVLIGMNSGLA